MSGRITYREALKRASSLLVAGNYHYKIAEWLMLHLLQIDRQQWIEKWNQSITYEEDQLYQGWIQEVLNGKPYQYITGVEEFYGREFQVSPAVLIPRPETELLVEQVIKFQKVNTEGIEDVGKDNTEERLAETARGELPLTMRKAIGVDVGTGSGVIAITLALELGDSVELLAVDISSNALEIARRNAVSLGAKVQFIQSDLLSALRDAKQQVDFIVSNPPYIPHSDITTMHRNVVEHEPHLALFAEDQGLWFYKEIVNQSRGILRSGGLLAFEIGIHQEEPVVQMIMSVYPKALCQIEKDYSGINRMVFARINN